jgi:2-polyprenyl-6-methoxyphenol hydroxylase-like FAD-dependent oxidoreductase
VSRDLRIAIVGFGIAGAALALLLGRRGYAINCFERSDVGVDGGAGLLLAPPALTLLRSLGLEEEIRRRGSVVSTLRATTTDGKVLLNWDATRWGYSCLGLGVQRRCLLDVLSHAAAGEVKRLRRGIEIAAVDSLRGVLVDTRGERFGPFDLVLACDGAGSTLRDALPAVVKRSQRYRWTALSCLMRDSAGTWSSGSLEQRFSGAHHVACWPVSGAEVETGSLQCVSVNVPAESVAQFADASGWLSEFERFGADFAKRCESLRPCGPWIALACRDVVLRRYSWKRLVFVGDAAHSLSPQLGQGARLALAGAMHLVKALDRHRQLDDALREYERRQRSLAARYQRPSRWITPLFQSQGRVPQWLRERVMPRLAGLAAVERRLLAWLCNPMEPE